MKKLLCLLACILIAFGVSACKDGEETPSLEQVNVTLNLDGGSISGDTTFVAKLWEDLTLPTPTKAGYEFNGWYSDGVYVNLKPFMLKKENVTLVATWKAKTYSVLLDFNGGNYTESDGVVVSKKSVFATFGQNVVFPEPTRSGYDFTGWYYGEDPVSTSPWNLDVGTVVIKAGWEQASYQVKFKFNGGTLVGGDQTLTEMVIPAKYNRTVEFPVLKKAGHKFLGWAFEGGEVLTSNVWAYDGIENPELYAVFEPIAVNYVLNADGGTVSVSDGSLVYGAPTQDIKNTIPVKEGYTFNCWTIDGEPLADNFNYVPSENKTSVKILATYTPNTYVLTLDANGGTVEKSEISVQFGVECDIPLPTAPDGYKFIGWKIKTTGEVVASYSGKIIWNNAHDDDLVARYASTAYVNFVHYDGQVDTVLLDNVLASPEEYVPIPNAKHGYTAVWELSSEEISLLTETTEIKAVLTPNSYAVIFKNGFTNVHTAFYVYDSYVTLPTEFNTNSELKKGGYYLLGWTANKNDTSDVLSGTIKWELTGNPTLYAVWAPKTYKITYDLSSIKADYSMLDKDGKLVSSTQEVVYKEEYNLYTLSARDNLISVTWLNGDNEIETSGTWNIKSDVTLTPKITYNPVKIEVNLNLNGGGGNTSVTFTLGKNFKNVSKTPTAPSGKKLVGYAYKGTQYYLNDLFLIVDYDGTPFKCLYEDYVAFTINLDAGEGTGEATAVIEYGQAFSTMSPMPVPPSGKKLVGFEYNGIEYDRNHLWEFASYDGGVFKAIYVEDNVDWSPSV